MLFVLLCCLCTNIDLPMLMDFAKVRSGEIGSIVHHFHCQMTMAAN